MASRIPQLPYVYWLIDQDRQETVGDFSYENRRRLTNYSILLDDTKKVGYEVKNPITGYNYAYSLRVKKKYADADEEMLKFSFLLGLGLSISGFSYLWGVRGRYVALMALLDGVFVSELLGVRSIVGNDVATGIALAARQHTEHWVVTRVLGGPRDDGEDVRTPQRH